MESGLIFERIAVDVSSFGHPSTLWKYGLLDRLELRLITDVSTLNSEGHAVSGLSPLTLGFKVVLSEEQGSLPTTSFIGHLTVPNLASDLLRTSNPAPAFRFTMQHTLTDELALGYNLGAEWDGESAQPTFLYTLTAGMSIDERPGVYAEVYGFPSHQSTADHRLDGGLFYLVQPNVMIDISGGWGITEAAPRFYLALGFSFRLPN